MGDDWNEDDTEVAAPVSAGLVEVAAADLPEIQLFGKWSCEEVNVSDMSLQDYIAVKEKFAKFLPHSSGIKNYISHQSWAFNYRALEDFQGFFVSYCVICQEAK